MAIPIFYDDFSDRKFMNRTGKDPWGRNLPEWKDPKYGNTPIPTNSFDASNGWFTCNWGDYFSISADLQTPTSSSSWKVEFDYSFVGWTGTYDGRYGQRFSWKTVDNKMYGCQFDATGHCWLTLNDKHLLGWNAPFTGPSGSNGNPLEDTWHHVEIYRLPNHIMYITIDGIPLHYCWSNGLGIQTDLGNVTNENISGLDNIELWDNPLLYTNLVSGQTNPDYTNYGIKSVECYWVYYRNAFANIKIWDDAEHYNIPLLTHNIPGTAYLYGTVYSAEGDSWANRQVRNSCIATTGTKTVKLQDGIYHFYNMPLGIYTLTAKNSGKNPTTITVNALSPGSYRNDIPLSSGSGFQKVTVTGKVTDSNNNPVNGASIFLQNYTATTDILGNYSISNVNESKCALIITKPGLESVTILADIIPTTSTIFNAVLQGSTIKGTINVTTIPVSGQIYINNILYGYGSVSTQLDPGTYIVSFGHVTGYTTPSNQEATILENQTTSINGMYVVCPTPICNINITQV